ncbi:MAG: dicarboxylate/amino acid:cation symporter [Treponema sp.]|jgi:Na+/H+-dicarboxylate symporter|nr:dicarboxylate/amino acid:cation symporter [Treponema sp.]
MSNDKTVPQKAIWLRHPVTVLVAAALGVGIGLCNAWISALIGIKDLARLIAVPGQVYLFYLQMAALPLVIAAAAGGVGSLVRARRSGGIFRRFVLVFLALSVLAGVLGAVGGLAGGPGKGFGAQALVSLAASAGSEAGAGTGLGAFFAGLVPETFFQISAGVTLAALFFAVFFGIVIGFLDDAAASLAVNFLSQASCALQKVFRASLNVLPFALICFTAGFISKVRLDVFILLARFLIIFGIGAVLLFAGAAVVIWIRSGIANPLKVCAVLFEPVILAFAARSALVTIPGALRGFTQEFKLDSDEARVAVPLGITLGRCGAIFYFGLAAFFTMQAAGFTPNASGYVIIFLGVLCAGFAASGYSGLISLPLLGIFLNPVGVSADAALVILMALEPIAAPFRVFLDVYLGLAGAALAAAKSKESGAVSGGEGLLAAAMRIQAEMDAAPKQKPAAEPS